MIAAVGNADGHPLGAPTMHLHIDRAVRGFRMRRLYNPEAVGFILRAVVLCDSYRVL
jgi:hypothetical protein